MLASKAEGKIAAAAEAITVFFKKSFQFITSFFGTKVRMECAVERMKKRQGRIKIRYHCFFRKEVGDWPVHFLKNEEK